MKHFIYILLISTMLVACGHPSVPTDAKRSSSMPSIYPDYTEVTVPANICPLNFMVKDADEVVARLSCGTTSFTFGDGNKVMMDAGEWAELRDAARGKSISVEVFARKNDAWTEYKPFNIYVASDDIDRYVSFRLIQPSYVSFEGLSISQRDLTSFDMTDIYSNKLLQTEEEGQCINCHSYKNYKTDNMLFHMRIKDGGTMIVSDGKMEKIDLKTDSTISAGVYPAWNPASDVIAFSTNNTCQVFLLKDRSKIEVMDTQSDLVLYDVKTKEVSTICNDSDELEVFPTWSPDGKTLYYCDAHFALNGSGKNREEEMIMRYKEVQYSIYSRSYDPQTHSFGAPQLVYDAASQGKSATLPRISPDGKYLVFALGNYGCFHVWHSEADIYMLNLADNSVQPLTALNSALSESYPSFSSNGRWIMTASRRDDGNYTRPYISYLDKSGKCHKAFELPQEDPEFYGLFLRSFNRPEFMVEPVRITPREFAEKAKLEPVKAKYISR